MEKLIYILDLLIRTWKCVFRFKLIAFSCSFCLVMCGCVLANIASIFRAVDRFWFFFCESSEI